MHFLVAKEPVITHGYGLNVNTFDEVGLWISLDKRTRILA